MIDLRLGDCIEVMREMDANSVDAIVTDPPYGLEFMGKEWDKLSGNGTGPKAGFGDVIMPDGANRLKRPSYIGGGQTTCRNCGGDRYRKSLYSGGIKRKHCECDNPTFINVGSIRGKTIQDWHYEWAIEALRVAKPGAHLLAFGGTRTFHRLACAIEDAGWEIRDTVMWVYGSGFPKSHDVSKAIDKMAGAEREVIGLRKDFSRDGANRNPANHNNTETLHIKDSWDNPVTIPSTSEAKEWEGWGTALKPAWEPVIVARKPLEGTVAANVLKWGTGAINIDGCRVGAETRPVMVRTNTIVEANAMSGKSTGATSSGETTSLGRWAANLIHDGSDEVLEGFPETKSGSIKAGRPNGTSFSIGGELGKRTSTYDTHGDSGSAARFFYVPKASKSDRDEGLEGMEKKGTCYSSMGINDDDGIRARGRNPDKQTRLISNHHPTVKPTELMRYLCRLVTPPGGIILDPFMGSGSTGKAAVLEGFSFIGIEKEAEYLEIAEKRIAKAMEQMRLPI